MVAVALTGIAAPELVETDTARRSVATGDGPSGRARVLAAGPVGIRSFAAGSGQGPIVPCDARPY